MHLEKLDVEGKAILKWIFQGTGCEGGYRWDNLHQISPKDPRAGYCEHGATTQKTTINSEHVPEPSGSK
jgi:hypothetical protein